MRKLINWIKKKISGSSNSGNFPRPPDFEVNQTEIEKKIDSVVQEYLPQMGNLINYKSNTHYWQSVFKALAYAESGFKLNCRYVEPPSLGKDAITGVQNTSEGLLQVSYQDSKYHACNFNWATDRVLPEYSMNKTIFNLENNIKCGMQIMNKLITRNNNFIFNSGNYWAVLKPNNNRHYVFIDTFNKYLKGGIV